MNKTPKSKQNADGGSMRRLCRWFVRGTKPDGTRWESAHKHDTREDAQAEIGRWGPEMGDMKIMRVTYPKGFKHLREQSRSEISKG